MANRLLLNPSVFHENDVHLDVRSNGNIPSRPLMMKSNIGRENTDMIGVDGNGGIKQNVTGIWTFDSQAKWIHGFRFRLVSFFGQYPTVADSRICSFFDAGTLQCYFSMEPDGSLSVYRGDGTLIDSTAPGLIGVDRLHFIEFEATVAQAGSYDIRIGGVSVKSGSADMTMTGNDTADGVSFLGHAQSSSGEDFHYQDIYLNDGSGADNNGPMGDIRLDSWLPTGDSATHDDFTPSAGTDDYAKVNAAEAPMSDADYTGSGTVTDRQAFTISALGTTLGTIKAMSVDAAMRKTDVGGRSMETLVRDGGTTYAGTGRALNEVYLFYREAYDKHPNTAALTQANIEASEFGVGVQA